MLRVCYSNRFERLVDSLIADLGDRAADPFEPTHIVVPSRNVAAYVKLAVARARGIVANLEFPFLERFLSDRIPASQAHVRPVDKHMLHALLCGVLADPGVVSADHMEPVRAYLAAGGSEPDAIDLRRFQLADQLSGLYVNYAVSRPELVRRWRDGPAMADTALASVERWQRDLWLEMNRRLADQAEVSYRSLPELLTEVAPRELDVPPRVFAIGFSYIAPAYQHIFARLAQVSDVRMYALNPCREFWEDVRDEAGDTPALRLWARPGRDNVRALNALTNHDFDEHYIDPTAAGATVLTTVQADILERRPARTEVPAHLEAGDDSIRVLGCPGIQREVEIIGNEIWALMRADTTLRFNDIAVYVNRQDRELYQAHIPSVFGELHDIPHHVVDVPLAVESRIVEALQLVLDLPFGRFSRPELLRVLTHPSVLARYPHVDPNDWVHWSERLGIVHGADHDDHADTYITRDVFNWEQGIKRLALGAFMAGEKSGEQRAITFAGTSYLPEELPAEALPSAARFSLLTRSLIEDARFCRKTLLPLSEWRVFLDLLATSYLAPVTDDDERNFARCRAAIEHLTECDVDGRPVSYRIACELVRARLESLRGAKREFLAHGVTVSPLLPMRPIPYRVVFITGMGEGRFPSADRDSPLDLRSAARRAGDVSPRERDRYLFLETLLSVRERLYISYISRDDQTGEPVEPSPVVAELLHLVRTGYVGAAGAERLVVHHPLRRYTDDPGAASSAAQRQARAVRLRTHLEAHLAATGQASPHRADLARALSEPRFAELRASLGMLDLDPEQRAVEPITPLSITKIRGFLESPLQAWASVVLRLRETDTEDLLARADEAFETAFLPGLGMLRDVFTEHLRAGPTDDLAARYRERALYLELSGNAPTGVFSTLERESHAERLATWREALGQIGDITGDYTTYSFGRAREHASVDALRPPLALDIDLPGGTTRVELYGRTQLVGPPSVGSLVLAPGARAEEKHMLRGFVDHVVLSAAGIADGRPHTTTVIAATKHARHRFAPLSREQATAYLSAMVTDLLGGNHEYLLPCEAVLKQHRKPAPLATIVANLRGQSRKRFSDMYGPVPASRLEGLDVPAEAPAMVERRFGPLFERWEQLDG